MAVLHNTYKKASLAYRNRFKRGKDDKPKTEKEEHFNEGLKTSIMSLSKNSEFKMMYSLPPLTEVSEYSDTSYTSYGILTKKSIHGLNSLYQTHHGSIVNSLNYKMKTYMAPAILDSKDAQNRYKDETNNFGTSVRIDFKNNLAIILNSFFYFILNFFNILNILNFFPFF